MKRILYIICAFVLCLLSAQAQKTFTVIIDAGHGGKDKGAVGAKAKEKTINLAVALKLGTLIEKNHKDVKIIYTRKKDVFVPLNERANIANRNDADLFISIHANSVRKGRKAFGTETYTLGLANSAENLDVAMRENSVILMEDDYLQKYEGFNPKSSESYIIFEFMQNKHMEQSVYFASEIESAFVKSKRHSRGVRQAGFLVLKKTSMPGVLVELGFLSNREEERFMMSKKGQAILSKAIYTAFANFKNDYDRKSGGVNIKTSGVAEKAGSGNVQKIYKVQILTSEKKIPVDSKFFKGYKDISEYFEKGLYKYTYGKTADYKKILKIHKNISKDFKDAFIVQMKNGRRL